MVKFALNKGTSKGRPDAPVSRVQVLSLASPLAPLASPLQQAARKSDSSAPPSSPETAAPDFQAGFDQLLAGCDVGSLLAAADDDDDSQPSTRATSPPRAGRTDSGVSSKGRGIEKTSSAPRREGPLKAKKDHRPHMMAPARKPASTAASDKRSSALKGALEAWAADLSAMDDLCGALSGAGVQK